MRVLLAIDEFSPSNEALMEIKNRSWPPDTTVRVFHVIEKFVPPAQALWYDGGGNPQRVREEVAANANDLLKAAAEFLSTKGLIVETKLRFGTAPKMIIDEAKEWDADLIVIGSHCYTGLKRLLSGGVGRAVMASAPCSVEVAHSKRTHR